MNILLDENITWKIAKDLLSMFDNVLHINQISLKRLDDYEIWNYARKNNYTIITYDSDFADISLLRGNPPKIIWLRFGNASKEMILNKIISNIDRIREFDNNEDLNVLEIY